MQNVDETRWWSLVEDAKSKTGAKTLPELAEKLGYAPSYFQQLKVRGNDPKTDMIRTLCLKTNTSADWLLGLTNIRERRWGW